METRLLPTDNEGAVEYAIAHGAELLRTGKLLAFPTETVYGLGANALDEIAVRRIYEVKGRPKDNPMIVHVHAKEQARELMQSVPPCFDELANEFWPGPLTLIVERNAAIPDVVTAGLSGVALRLPDHALARALLRRTALPVAAPSANVSGRPSPTDARMVMDYLDGRIDAVLDGGPCAVGIESTVLDISMKQPVILRPGTVTREDIEDVLQTYVSVTGVDATTPRSPGVKYRHYAPRARLIVFPYSDDDGMAGTLGAAIGQACRREQRTGLLAPERFRGCGEHVFYSLREGTAVDYARHLYAGLATLDAAAVAVIFCPGIPATGIGAAVMNRLCKASGL
ncbi:MAG: threonylcarbamoyl-AMP synthase [Bacteroidetes bacterium]|nr:threonylcarbamoyl-AMP synthase [Bacteroidota bacterium]